MPQSNSKSADSNNQSMTKETEQQKRNIPEKVIPDEIDS